MSILLECQNQALSIFDVNRLMAFNCQLRHPRIIQGASTEPLAESWKLATGN